MIDAGNGVISSVGFFESADHAEESARIASDWVRQENLGAALPNPPKITSGEVLVHKTSELVGA